MNSKDSTYIESGKPGPTVAIFAGVHGNERAGVYALHELLPTLKIMRGRLLIVFANPPAIAANVRMLGKNLNRCFYKNNTGTSPEDIRARELMKLLDECDALLDLHMFYDDDGEPFVICEENALQLARIFDVPIISTNWTAVEPGGTDSYMFEAGKLGICLECGPLSKSREYTDFAKKAVYQFLKFFDMTSQPVNYSSAPKRIIRAQKAVPKKSDAFTLCAGFKNFQRLLPGQIIATEHAEQFTAKTGECIIFPHYNARIGEEAYIIGVEKPA